jgi:hypothetical protein
MAMVPREMVKESVMVQRHIPSKTRRVAAGALVAAITAAFLPHASFAMNGVSDCVVSKVDDGSDHTWSHAIVLQVPEGKSCSIYVADDSAPGKWTHCWDKTSADNPVTGTCSDPIDNPSFNNWKAKAICGDQTYIAYCRTEH